MQTFELALHNDKVKQYRLFAFLIVLINTFFMAVLAFTTDSTVTRYGSLATLLLIAVVFYAEHFRKKEGKEFNAKAIAPLVFIVFYVVVQYWWPAIILIGLSILFRVSTRPLRVMVSQDHISYPSFPKRIIEWDELNNLVLKDGLLTIDFKNNKLAQVTVIGSKNDPAPDEKEFNDFCKKHLGSGAAVI